MDQRSVPASHVSPTSGAWVRDLALAQLPAGPGSVFANNWFTCFLDKEATGLNKQDVPLNTFLYF